LEGPEGTPNRGVLPELDFRRVSLTGFAAQDKV
jgi:hypothetical protein